jgi:hypothetical protein
MKKRIITLVEAAWKTDPDTPIASEPRKRPAGTLAYKHAEVQSSPSSVSTYHYLVVSETSDTREDAFQLPFSGKDVGWKYL